MLEEMLLDQQQEAREQRLVPVRRRAAGLAQPVASLGQAPDQRARQPERHRRSGIAGQHELGRELAQQRIEPLHRRLASLEAHHGRPGEQGAERLADRLELALDQEARAQRQHQAIGAGLETETMHHAGRNHDRRRPGDRLVRLVEQHRDLALAHPEDLVQALVQVGVDLPVVEAAARPDLLDVQHLLARTGRLAVEREARHLGAARRTPAGSGRDWGGTGLDRIGIFHLGLILNEKYYFSG